MTSPGQPPAAPSHAPYGSPPPPPGSPLRYEAPPSTGSERFRYLGVCLAAGVIAAVPAAWIWTSLADPPSARLVSNGLKFGEASFDQVTAITLWFVVVGFAFGLGLGLAASVFGRRHGWVTVLAVLLTTCVGASLTLWLGIHVFGPDNPVDFVALFNATPQQRTRMLEGYQKGDKLVSSLALTSPVGLIGWPAGGMLGIVAGASWWPRELKAPPTVRIRPQMPPS